MKAQKFRLQSILDLRAAALDDAKNALQKALVDFGAAQLACDQAREEANTFADQICSASPTQSASVSQTLRQSYLYLTRRIQALEGQINACELAVQKCRMQSLKPRGNTKFSCGSEKNGLRSDSIWRTAKKKIFSTI